MCQPKPLGDHEVDNLNEQTYPEMTQTMPLSYLKGIQFSTHLNANLSFFQQNVYRVFHNSGHRTLHF